MAIVFALAFAFAAAFSSGVAAALALAFGLLRKSLHYPPFAVALFEVVTKLGMIEITTFSFHASTSDEERA